MKLDYQDKTKEDWFLVSWTLSNKCNYKCSYCPDILHNGTTGQPKWETVKNFVEILKYLLKKFVTDLVAENPLIGNTLLILQNLLRNKDTHLVLLQTVVNQLITLKK